MTYANKLKYAGADPYQPEADRDDISYEEYELLTQDGTYKCLAQVRWLTDQLEADLAGESAAPDAVQEALFDAAAVSDAPIHEAVEAYVDAWLNEYRKHGTVDDRWVEVSADA